MSTRDTMELKEETIRAQYEAALGMVLLDISEASISCSPMKSGSSGLTSGLSTWK